MGVLKLGKMTTRSLFKKSACQMYPVNVREPFDRTKGHVVNNMETCILCGICEKRCPTEAIVVNKAEGTWTIDVFRCIQCRSCVLACPKHSLTMETTYPAAASGKSVSTTRKPDAAPASDAED